MIHASRSTAGSGSWPGVKATLRAGGDNDGVLHHLGLDQAEHLGAEVVTAIPTSAKPPCNATEAQVNTLNARGVDENLRTGAGQGLQKSISCGATWNAGAGAVSKVCVGARIARMTLPRERR